MKNKQPLVSVIMPVYNGSRFVEKAIESIVHQSYQRFEFIIADDGSTDTTWSKLQHYAKQDKRIKLIQNAKHLGVSRTMKEIIKRAHGVYLARMDADDIAYTNRLEKQVVYLAAHPETVAIGGQCTVIDAKGKIIGRKTFPIKYRDVYNYIFRLVPVQQPTLMISRRHLPKNFSFYVDGRDTAEEIELLFKLFQYGKIENIPDTILKYRLHGHNTSLHDIKKTFRLTLQSRIKAIIRYGYQPNILGLTATIIETIVIAVLPQALLRELFYYLRGMKRPMIKLSYFSFPPMWAKMKQYALSLR